MQRSALSSTAKGHGRGHPAPRFVIFAAWIGLANTGLKNQTSAFTRDFRCLWCFSGFIWLSFGFVPSLSGFWGAKMA
jgi:hypothetical protein